MPKKKICLLIRGQRYGGLPYRGHGFFFFFFWEKSIFDSFCLIFIPNSHSLNLAPQLSKPALYTTSPFEAVFFMTWQLFWLHLCHMGYDLARPQALTCHPLPPPSFLIVSKSFAVMAMRTEPPFDPRSFSRLHLSLSLSLSRYSIAETHATDLGQTTLDLMVSLPTMVALGLAKEDSVPQR